MPYIKLKRRKALNDDSKTQDVGELTYVICKAIDDFLRVKAGKDDAGLRYQHCAEVMGALACSQQELYRKVIKPLEQVKIIENGDMWHSPKLIKKDYK